MAIADIAVAAPPAALGGRAGLAHDIERVAERVRRWTVQVRSGGQGVGSGVIWRGDGLIVTNAHVARSDRAFVALADGRELEARLAVRDARRDLALLVVDASELPAAEQGDPLALRPGEVVMAIGSPWGITGAMALGVVHAVEGSDDRGAPRWIRADVRLAPGNSGGPLVDAAGRVVGINAMIVNGLGIAIPTTAVARFLVRGQARAA